MSNAALSRRNFMKTAGAIGLSLTASSWSRVYGANDRLRVGAVGVGGRGWADLSGVAASPHVAVTALCDIDEGEPHLGRAAKRFPDAKTFTDWRKLFDEDKSFDAMIVATPDHMHAPVALPGMALNKHIFCQKPLTHTVHEARQMAVAAQRHGVVTQMGNQIQSHEAYRTAVKAVRSGVIGKVDEVISWQSGKMSWMLVDDRPEGSDPIPDGVHWNDWLGVAPERPFKKSIYHSFNWRAFQDFSNGQLGDFGCHILDPVFMALGLTAPTQIRAEAPPINSEVWTRWARVHYEFPGTDMTTGDTLKLTWYDGEGKLPPKDKLGLPEGTKLPGSGSLLIGEKGSLLIPHVSQPRVLSGEAAQNDSIEKVPSIDHFITWVDACRGEGKNFSPFSYAGPLTETVLLGSIAIRLPSQTLNWDAKAATITNNPTANNLLTKPYRKGWEPEWLG